MRSWPLALSLALLVLGLAELLSRTFHPYWHNRSSWSEPRNPLFRRGWPEYCQQPVSNNKNRIIIIGNSQGYGKEENANAIYTSQLKQILKNSSNSFHTTQIENWCAGGAIGHDLLLLTAKALSQHPKQIIVATYSQNFKMSVIQKPLGYSNQDVPLLLGEWKTTFQLPAKFWTSTLDIETFLRSLFFRHSALLRSRTYLYDLLQRYCNIDYSHNIGNGFYQQQTYWFHPLLGKEDEPQNKTSSGLIKNSIPFEKVDEAYIHMFIEWLAKPRSTSVNFMLMPLATSLLTPDAMAITQKFNTNIIQQAQGTPISVWDFTTALPEKDFYTHTHFNASNHFVLAQKISQKILQAHP